MELTLLERHAEAGDAVSLIFERPPGLVWTAGQYLAVNLPHDDADARGPGRYFTIASAPHENVVRLTTRTFAAGSTFKHALLAMQPGDTLSVDGGPGGNFCAPSPVHRHLFVAGGIGITPFRSILVDLDRRGPAPEVTLVYATRREAVFREELDALAARSRWLTVRNVFEPAIVDAPLLREALTDDQQVWISGPELMVHALHALVAAVGVQQERIKRDAFPGYDEVRGTETPARAPRPAEARG
jgi:ferredoxin-NADP reductase